MMKSLFIFLLAVGYSLQTPIEVEDESNDISFTDDDITNRSVNTSRAWGQKRYYIGMFFKANWFRAAQFCRYSEMQLATINNEHEQYLLENLIKDYGLQNERFWISGMDKAKEGSFFWMSSGKPFTYSNWAQGEPNNVGSNNGETEDCVELRNNQYGFKWNDYLCSIESFFICEDL